MSPAVTFTEILATSDLPGGVVAAAFLALVYKRDDRSYPPLGTVVTLASGGGQATNGDNTLRSWDSSSASLVTCPHASGDISIAYAFNDALLAELARLGTTDVGGTSTINDAGNQPLPAVWGWHLLTDHGVVVVWVTVLDASGPDCRVNIANEGRRWQWNTKMMGCRGVRRAAAGTYVIPSKAGSWMR